MEFNEVKQYWPYALGGVAGLLFIIYVKNRSGSGTSGGPSLVYQQATDPNAAQIAAVQAQKDVASNQLDFQKMQFSANLKAQVDANQANINSVAASNALTFNLQKATLDAQTALGMRGADNAQAQTDAAAAIGFLNAQASAASAAGDSAAKILQAANLVTQQTVAGAFQTGGAALSGAAMAQAAGLKAVGDGQSAFSNAIGQMAQAAGVTISGVAQSQAQTAAAASSSSSSGLGSIASMVGMAAMFI